MACTLGEYIVVYVGVTGATVLVAVNRNPNLVDSPMAKKNGDEPK